MYRVVAGLWLGESRWGNGLAAKLRGNNFHGHHPSAAERRLRLASDRGKLLAVRRVVEQLKRTDTTAIGE